MDGKKKPKRVTSSQDMDADDSGKKSKGRSRSKKSQDINENDSAHNADDYDDGASSKSSSSTSSKRSCKVVLQRENLDELRAIAHSTRARSSSQLTVENVAAHLNPARRALRSSSVASDGTGSTNSRTTRSTRGAAAAGGVATIATQKTPKKGGNTSSRPATPSRRSSRLLSENEKAVDSPAKPAPAKRNLRSNSVISADEISPKPITRTRSSGRLAETQGTPKKLNTRVSKIKTEPTTPRRASSRLNKSTVATDVIDEESSDDDKSKTDMPLNEKKDQTMKSVDENEKTEATNEVELDDSMVTEHHDEPKDNASALVKSPIVLSMVNKMDESETIEQINNDEPLLIDQKTATPKNDLSEASQGSSTVLITVTTTETIENDKLIEQEAETPTVEPSEPMESSLTEHIEQVKSSEAEQVQIVDTSGVHGNVTPRTNEAPNELGSMEVTSIVNEGNPSPPPVEPEKEQQKTPKARNEKPTSADADDIPTKLSIDETLTELLKSYTPKPKSRTSNAFSAMNVTALANDSPSPTPAPAPVSATKDLKVSSKRLSLNSTTQSTGFDQMDVTAMTAADFIAVENQSDNLDTQEEAEKVSETGMASDQFETPQQEFSRRLSIELLPERRRLNKKVLKSSNSGTSPEKTPIAEQSNNLTSFITPTSYKDCESKFSTIADNLTPGMNDTIMNRCINDILEKLTTETSLASVQPVTDNKNRDQVSEGCVAPEEKTDDHCAKHDVSIINQTQSDLDETALPTEIVQQEKPASIAKSVRKSVQIMTPKNQKAHSTEKRTDTPYPTGTVLETGDSPMEFGDGKKDCGGVSVQDSERSQNLRASWSKTVKRISLSEDAPEAIDAFGIDKSKNEEPKKEAVVARNNWCAGLIDSESEQGSVAPDSDGESESEQSKNEFIDDEADEAENYNSGDSMDSDERREIAENEIEEIGDDLGSEDSEEGEEEEMMEYDYSDGFVVKDTDDEEERVTTADSNRRRRRIVIESSSDENSIDSSNNGSSNEVVSIAMQVESVVVLGGTDSADATIVEGRTFATTYLIPENDTKEADSRTVKIDATEPIKIEPIEQQNTEENEQNVIESLNADETSDIPKTEISEVEADLTEKSDVITANVSETVPVPENIVQSEEAEAKEPEPEPEPEKSDSGAVTLDSKKEEKILTKKRRTSLPGIDRLSNASSNKGRKANRMSLGDLNLNHQNLRGEVLDAKPLIKSKSISSKVTLIEKEEVDSTDAPIIESKQTESEEREMDTNESTSSIENVSPNHSKINPNVSTQEENNNLKNSAKKSKTVETIPNDEVIPTVSEPEPNISTEMMNDSDKKKKARSKRKFEEIDIDDVVRSKPKKLLKVIKASSGDFFEEPQTPEKKNKYAFQVTPLTPVNKKFRVENQVTKSRSETNKRKSIYVDQDELITHGLLPKPQWQINTQFEEVRPSKRARKLEVGSTEMILKPLESKSKSKPTIPADLRQFRHRQMYRSDIPREDKRSRLRLRYKERANFH